MNKAMQKLRGSLKVKTIKRYSTDVQEVEPVSEKRKQEEDGSDHDRKKKSKKNKSEVAETTFSMIPINSIRDFFTLLGYADEQQINGNYQTHGLFGIFQPNVTAFALTCKGFYNVFIVHPVSWPLRFRRTAQQSPFMLDLAVSFALRSGNKQVLQKRQQIWKKWFDRPERSDWSAMVPFEESVFVASPSKEAKNLIQKHIFDKVIFFDHHESEDYEYEWAQIHIGPNIDIKFEKGNNSAEDGMVDWSFRYIGKSMFFCDYCGDFRYEQATLSKLREALGLHKFEKQVPDHLLIVSLAMIAPSVIDSSRWGPERNWTKFVRE